jgi:alpha-tubulin suppressor-like RCC1 family protein
LLPLVAWSLLCAGAGCGYRAFSDYDYDARAADRQTSAADSGSDGAAGRDAVGDAVSTGTGGQGGGGSGGGGAGGGITDGGSGGATDGSSDQGQVPATLELAAAASASPDFGTIAVGSMQDETFTIRNTGGQPSSAVTVALPAGVFAVLPAAAGECASGATTLGVGASCNIRVRFVPTRPGRFAATLTASASSGGTATLAIAGQTTGVWAVAAGASSYHTCALLAPGTVSCWGANDYNQLGSATPGSGFAMSAVPLQVAGLTNIVGIAVGAKHSCALLGDGTVRCWGDNAYGKLGSTTTAATSLVPLTVSGLSTVVSVAAGTDFTCALLQDGTVRCWGRNDSSQLGAVTPDTRSTTPVTVGGLSGVSSMAAGAAHICAVVGAGLVNCWGAGSFGQLGNAMTTDSTMPVMVGLSTFVSAVATGNTHTCAVRMNGALSCWGRNSYGQLGDPSVNGMSESPISVLIASPDFVAIGAGAFHTCAVHMSGIASCWGLNSNGQLGASASVASSASPIDVLDGPSFATVTGGQYHTCGLTRTGAVFCWGDNSEGQLGVVAAGSMSSQPVAITF